MKLATAVQAILCLALAVNAAGRCNTPTEEQKQTESFNQFCENEGEGSCDEADGYGRSFKKCAWYTDGYCRVGPDICVDRRSCWNNKKDDGLTYPECRTEGFLPPKEDPCHNTVGKSGCGKRAVKVVF